MTHRHALQALLIAVGFSLALYLLPMLWPVLWWLGWPLHLLATLVHELGHGLAALLVGGGFEALRIHPDGSGVATTLSDGTRLTRAWIAAGGPLGPPLAALGLFLAARRPAIARAALSLLALGLVAVLLLWVRNLFGSGVVLVLAAVLGCIAWKATPRQNQIAVCFLAVQMSLAVFSRADYLFAATARTEQGPRPSDTAQIADALWLPHWFWGSLIVLASLTVLVLGLILFAQALRARSVPAASSPAPLA